MKRMYFFRHGKSSWEGDLEDFDRPLASRGEKAARLIGKYLNDHYHDREIHAFSSAANRALSTFEIVKEAFVFQSSTILKDLYTFNPSSLRRQIETLEDSLKEIALFGHNPAFESLVMQYTRQYFDKFPTCALAVIEFDESCWKDCKQGVLLDFVTPKMLG